MRKAWIALAALSVASGGAVAQSSVTLYGVADIAIGKVSSTGASKWGVQSNSIVANGNSRIGFTGKEDLGGGLWAGFMFEGTVFLSDGHTPAHTWNRSAWVGLGSDSFGTVRLGRQYSPAFDGQGVYELTGWANYSIIGNTYGWGGNHTLRVNSLIEYKTPVFAGLSATLGYVPKADGALIIERPTGVGKANQSDRWTGNIVYNQGPIAAAFTFDKSNHTDATATTTAAQTDKANYSLGGRYTFGKLFALAASYNRTNAAQSWRNGHDGGIIGGRRYGYTLGGNLYLDAFTITLDLARDTTNDIYDGKKYTSGLLAVKYALSKRTFLYADYLRLDGNNNYGLGIRHNF